MKGKHDKLKGHIAAIFTIAVWGSTFVSTKVLLRHFSAEEILFLRFLMGLFVLWALKPKPMTLSSRKHIIYFFGAGLTGVVLYYLCENIALNYGDASIVGVIVCSAPIFSAIFSAIFFKEKLKKSFFVGFLVAIIGLLLISVSASTTGINTKGLILAFSGSLSWGVYSIITRKIAILGYNSFGTTQYTFLFAVIMMIPVIFFNGFRISAVMSMNFTILLNLLYLGLCASALCFITWNFSVKKLGVLKASVYLYASPVITIIFAAILLKERMTIKQIIGTVFVLFGLVLSEGQVFKRREK